MTKKFMQPLITLALTASFLCGQGPNGPPDPATMVQRRVSFLTTLLSLTTTQQQQATTIFTNAASAEATFFSSLKTARQSLDAAIKNNDSVAIDQISTTIGNLTAQRTATDAKADAAFYLILTSDQQTKFTQFEAQGGAFGHGPGPGRHP